MFIYPTLYTYELSIWFLLVSYAVLLLRLCVLYYEKHKLFTFGYSELKYDFGGSDVSLDII